MADFTQEDVVRVEQCDRDSSRLERLALSLRAHAYAMGAPRTEQDEEVALGAARLILPAMEESAKSCRNCEGAGWVCENHQDRPWGGGSSSPIACECGAGAPCPVCEREMTCAPFMPWWQTMETAPKDGTEILVAGGTVDDSASMGGPWPLKGIALVTWVDGIEAGWRGENSGHHDEWFWHEPQCWMPLPPLPSEGVSAGLKDIRARHRRAAQSPPPVVSEAMVEVYSRENFAGGLGASRPAIENFARWLDARLSSPSRGCDVETIEACAKVAEEHQYMQCGPYTREVTTAIAAAIRNLGKETREGEG